ncbi:hypothetical protein LINGRAHAP2_LOCUS35084 [Linum grandiflorum]
MNPVKAIGLDGCNPDFYQKVWHVVGGQATMSCTEWLERGELPRFMQKTIIVLLPKI